MTAAPLEDLLKRNDDKIYRLLEGVSELYSLTVVNCKRNLDNALAGSKEAQLAIGKEFVNLIEHLSKESRLLLR